MQTCLFLAFIKKENYIDTYFKTLLKHFRLLALEQE